MLLRNVHRLALLVGLALVCLYAASHYGGLSSRSWSEASKLQWPKPNSKSKPPKGDNADEHDDNDGAHGSQWAAATPQDGKSMTPDAFKDAQQQHQEVFSVSTPDKKFVRIDFGGMDAFNPNILPHPDADDIWIVVAQKVNAEPSIEFKEVHCEAIMWDGALRCRAPPAPLPVAPTEGG